MSFFDTSLPAGWSWDTISTHYRITKKPKTRVYSDFETIPFVPMDSVPANGREDVRFELRRPSDIISGTYFERGDVLLSKITPSFENGKQALANNIPTPFGVASTEIIPLQSVTPGANHRFLFFYLLHPEVRATLTGKMEGSTGRQRVSEHALRDFPIAMPPPPEQQQISAALCQIQRAVEVEEDLIASARHLKQSAMQSLFTSGLSQGPKKETQWGSAPAAWEVCKLETVVDSIDYGLSEAIPKDQPPQGIKIVSTADITRDGTLLYHKIRRVDTTDAVVNRLRLQTGDVLFNWRNSQELIGKTAVFDEQAETHIFASFVLRIRCTTTRLHNHFLQYLMNYYRETGVFVTLSRRAVNQANYNRNEISVLSIPVPPIQEQREIATILQTTDRKISIHERKRTALRDLFKTTLHQLMTAQVRVSSLDIATREATPTAKD